MNSSSAPQTYSITLDDPITVSSGFIAQDISSIDPSMVTFTGAAGSSVDTITITGGGSGYTVSNVTLSNIDINPSIFTWKTEEFVDCFPDFDKVNEMCNQYPALDIALKKFKEVYKMVEDDYNAQKGGKYTP